MEAHALPVERLQAGIGRRLQERARLKLFYGCFRPTRVFGTLRRNLPPPRPASGWTGPIRSAEELEAHEEPREVPCRGCAISERRPPNTHAPDEPHCAACTAAIEFYEADRDRDKRAG